MSHIGASAPANYRAGVIKDMGKHFKRFWEKLTFEESVKPHKRAPAHLLIYRSAPSGSSQIKEVLAHEVTAIRNVLGTDLGSFEFSPETSELIIEHPMATTFPDAEFAVVLTVCPAAEMRRSAGKAEEIAQHARPTFETLTCQGATVGSEGRHILKFKLREKTVPLLQAMAILVSEFETPKPEAFQVHRPHYLSMGTLLSVRSADDCLTSCRFRLELPMHHTNSSSRVLVPVLFLPAA